MSTCLGDCRGWRRPPPAQQRPHLSRQACRAAECGCALLRAPSSARMSAHSTRSDADEPARPRSCAWRKASAGPAGRLFALSGHPVTGRALRELQLAKGWPRRAQAFRAGADRADASPCVRLCSAPPGGYVEDAEAQHRSPGATAWLPAEDPPARHGCRTTHRQHVAEGHRPGWPARARQPGACPGPPRQAQCCRPAARPRYAGGSPARLHAADSLVCPGRHCCGFSLTLAASGCTSGRRQHSQLAVQGCGALPAGLCCMHHTRAGEHVQGRQAGRRQGPCLQEGGVAVRAAGCQQVSQLPAAMPAASALQSAAGWQVSTGRHALLPRCWT